MTSNQTVRDIMDIVQTAATNPQWPAEDIEDAVKNALEGRFTDTWQPGLRFAVSNESEAIANQEHDQYLYIRVWGERGEGPIDIVIKSDDECVVVDAYPVHVADEPLATFAVGWG